jgi:hypothetical protein
VGVVDYTTFDPAVNTSVFSNVQSSLYWSASSSASNSALAWNVIFRNGFGNTSFKSFSFLVWCVRSGS